MMIVLAVRMVDAIHAQNAAAATTDSARPARHTVPRQNFSVPRKTAYAMKPPKYSAVLVPSKASVTYGFQMRRHTRGTSSRYRTDTRETPEAKARKVTAPGEPCRVSVKNQLMTASPSSA